ncbi:MAG: xanthine dehydrogenase family protein subunit M [Deltaproteobacteria bacterium]|nr:xanthine dehydrogenase family protein subunit M [Deltaproteobacteria bacterium]
MPLPRFRYVAPESLEAACELLAEHGDRARVMAGGTDLLLRMKRLPRAGAPEVVIGLRGVPGLDTIRIDDGGLSIGALTLLASVAGSTDVNRLCPALASAARSTATVQIRNMGTVVGNLCNASPAADTATPLLVYGASVLLVRPGGERRTVPLEDFFLGPGRTALGPGEIVAEVRVPPPCGRAGSDYQRLSQRSRVDIAAVCVSTLVCLDRDGSAARVRIALGAVAPVPLRAKSAERVLEGRPPTAELVAQAAAAAAREARPISDVRSSGEYRRRMVEVLARRSLVRSASLAGGAA